MEMLPGAFRPQIVEADHDETSETGPGIQKQKGEGGYDRT
jgi:hypothetical protein